MKNNRIVIVDALRGFALLLIILIHFAEHFELFHEPEVNFLFSQETDNKILSLVFLILSGKAYSIFALLFGFSFYIQMSRGEEVGMDFRWRFLWRLIVLLIFGFVHSLIYKGDILHIYAILGLLLIPLYKINTKSLLFLAVTLSLQLHVIYKLFLSFNNPEFLYTENVGAGLWELGNKIYASGSFNDVISYNFWQGRSSVWGWLFYNGRAFQLLSLFIIGFLIGRKRIFENISENKKLLYKTLTISLIAAGVLIIINRIVNQPGQTQSQKQLLHILVNSYINLAFTFAIIGIVVLLYLKFTGGYIFKIFAAYGRMSLSNYVFQAVFGVLFFYEFGLGMYKYMGITISIFMGIIVFYVQAKISDFWIKRFYYGPLEWLWRALTFFNFRIKFKRERLFKL